jgi:hypothetical protein
MEKARSDRVRVKWYPSRQCPKCDGAGFVRSAADPERFMKCGCWKRYVFGGPPRVIPDGKMLAAEGKEE